MTQMIRQTDPIDVTHTDGGGATPTAGLPEGAALSPLAETLEYGARLNDVDKRAWILACAHLTGLGPESPRPDQEFIGRVMDFLRGSELFPWGPLAYVESEMTRPAPDDLSVMSFTHQGGDGVDALQMYIAFSTGGIVATSLTRSGHLDRQVSHPGDVLLSDVEATCVDLYALAGATALQHGYAGPIDMAVTAVFRPEGEPGLRLRCIDPESGTVRPEAVVVEEFAPVIGRIDMSRPLRDRYAALREMASEISRRFGADTTEFFIPVDEIDFAEYGRPEDPFDGLPPGARGPASA